MTGFVQGFQTGIIAGLEVYIADEYKDLKNKTENKDREFFVSFYALGASIASLVAGELCDFVGKKTACLTGEVLTGIGFLVTFYGKKIWIGIMGRFIAGLGTGFIIFAAPLYFSEVAGQANGGMCQSALVMSSGLGMIVGLNLATTFRHHWKKMYLWALVPLAGQFALNLGMPETA